MVDYITELLVDGAWLNITSDVRDSAPLVMERGRRDWATDADPSTMSLRLNNGESKCAAGVSGRYSPRNPRSDLFGKIGRNTQIRVREDTTRSSFLAMPGIEGSYAETPDIAALDITGDLDFRIDVEPTSWRPTGGAALARKYVTTSDQRSWVWYLNADGTVVFAWSPDGTLASRILVTSTVAIPEASTRLAIKVTLDVNNGAAGNDVTFSTAPDGVSGTYTQLGAVVTTAGVTSVFSSTSAVEVGQITSSVSTGLSGVTPFQGTLYAFRMRNSIGGTVVANPDFTGLEPGVRTFTDPSGKVWTLNGSATIVDTTIRFTGEAKSWPMEWDLSGADRWVRLTAAGLTRRLQQGTKPLKSSLFRDLSIKDDIVAYWPLEDVKGATRFNAGRADDNSFLEPFNDVTLAADAETFFSSAPLPTLGAGRITGNVPRYSPDDDQRLVFLIAIPADVTWAAEQTIARVYTSGSIERWEISKDNTDATRIRAYDKAGTEVENQPIAMNFFGVPVAFSLWLKQDGADVTWQMAIFPLSGGTAVSFGLSIVGQTYGRITRVSLGVPGTDMEGSTVGHLFILNDDVQSIWDTIYNSMVGWTGETGLERLVRISTDDGLPAVRSIGSNDAETMGPQLIKTQMELFREVPNTDLGILTDRPDALGLQYRSRIDLYSQEPVLILDYASGAIAAPFRPVEDDQSIVNEVTVERVRGASFTAAVTTGPLSSLDPPNGVGKYDVSQEVNIDSDARLVDQAFWRLHLGTVDEPRFPEVTLNLRNERAEARLSEALAVTVGDILRITNPPLWLPGGPYDLLVEAVREEKSSVEHTITFSCSPGSAWNAFMLDDHALGRLDAENSTLTAALTPTQTSFDVSTAAGSQLWLRQNVGMVNTATLGALATTPDAAALDILGSIEIRADVYRDSWSNFTTEEAMVAKWITTGNQRSYMLTVIADGFLKLSWSTTGANTLTETSEVPIPLIDGGRISLRATLNAATGDVTFYYSGSIDGTYTQLGAVQTGVATSIFASTSALNVGARATTALPWNGAVIQARVYDGIGGTVVANPSFRTQTIGTASFTDSAGRVWTLTGAAQIQPIDPFDIIVAGEVMTVQSITSTTSPQTFTVQRAVNGVAKAHTLGSEVVLAKPFVLSL